MSSLNFDIILSIPDIELTVENLDIDFKIFKNNKTECNKAIVNIWNLSDTYYENIVEKQHLIELYTIFADEDPEMIFCGYTENDKLRQKRDAADKCIQFTLIDGLTAYTATVNKSYRNKVVSTRIIEDCIKAMDISIGLQDTELPTMSFDSYKAYGFAHVVLQEICEPLGINFCVQNNMAHLIAADGKNNDAETHILNTSNCSGITRKGSGEFVIETQMISSLLPNDWVECEFDEIITDTVRIKEICHSGNNYGKKCISEITIEGN